jgi:hypothetical protein
VQVAAAFIDPFGIEGKVSLNEVTFSISSTNPALRSIFGESGDSTEPFEVALSLRLPKGVKELRATSIEEGVTGVRRTEKGKLIANKTETIGGSRALVRNYPDNNFHAGKGIVKFKTVNLADSSAVAVFKLLPKRYHESNSNSVDVFIEGKTNSYRFKTKIRVTIQPVK